MDLKELREARDSLCKLKQSIVRGTIKPVNLEKDYCNTWQLITVKMLNDVVIVLDKAEIESLRKGAT